MRPTLPTALALLLTAASALAGAQIPGHQGRGTVLRPNGWKIAPAGRHLPAGDLPL